MAERASRASRDGRASFVPSERQRGLNSDSRSAARAGVMRLPSFWREAGQSRVQRSNTAKGADNGGQPLSVGSNAEQHMLRISRDLPIGEGAALALGCD
jgi:hypothetical protein